MPVVVEVPDVRHSLPRSSGPMQALAADNNVTIQVTGNKGSQIFSFARQYPCQCDGLQHQLL